MTPRKKNLKKKSLDVVSHAKVKGWPAKDVIRRFGNSIEGQHHMKKQTNPNIKAHFLRSAFYVLLLLAVCLIPFALAQRKSNNRSGNAASAASAPTKNVAPVASDSLKVPFAPSSVRLSPEVQRLATKFGQGGPMVTGQTGGRATRVPPNPKRPAGVACTWSIVASYPEIVESPSVCSDGTFVYSAGGSFNGTPTAGFYRYDPVADSWTTLANMPTALGDARSVYAANTNSIYVFGGVTDFFNGIVTDIVQIYDVAAGTWSTGTPMPGQRFFPGTVYYDPNGKIYVAGGIDQTFFETSTTWEYDPLTDTWNTSRAPIPVAMGGSAVSLVGQNMYLQGSFGGGATDFNYRYDIVADSWTQMASMPRARYEAAGGAIGTRTYVAGGGDPFLGATASAQDRKQALIKAPETSFNTTFVYDTTTDTWFRGPNMNIRHSFTGGTTVGDLMIVVGGFDGVSGDTNTVEKGQLVACTPTPTPTPCPPTPTPTPPCGLVIGDGLTIGYAPNGYQQIASNIVNYTFSSSVSAPNDYAVFETHDPWGFAGGHVITDAITGAGHTYTIFGPCDLNGFDFSQYRVIVLNWDDTFVNEFVDFYTAALPALEAYSASGGVVWVQGAIQSFFGECYPLPFGGQACGDVFGLEDPIVDICSPMMTGIPNPIVGNAASHVSDTGLPVDAHVVVLSDVDNNPVLYDLTCQGAGPTPTPTPPLCASGLIQNGGFERGFAGWVIDGTQFAPVATTIWSHTGFRSAMCGGSPPVDVCGFSSSEPNGDSSMYQQFGPVPAGAQLSFWHWDCTVDSIAFDWQDAYITDTSGNILDTIYHQCSNGQCWVHQTWDLSPWAGQTIRVKFLVHQDGVGDLTVMFVDDVHVSVPGPCLATPTPTPRPTPAPRKRPTPPPR
jgi:N-acetylneuraminic acid mutarotase